MANASFFNKLTVDVLIEAYRRMGYRLFDTGEYNLNLFGIRNEDDPHSNRFNDILGVLYKKGGNWILKKYDGTTDPGLDGRIQPINSKGVAILAPGYHKAAFKLGYHKGQYRSLVQNSPLPLYRDNNKDDKLDFTSKPVPEMAGINFHRATAKPGQVSTLVQNWSAGCMVVAGNSDFNEFIQLCETAGKMYGPVFSFALFKQSEVFPK